MFPLSAFSYTSLLENEPTLRVLGDQYTGRFLSLQNMQVLSASAPFVFRAGIVYFACRIHETGPLPLGADVAFRIHDCIPRHHAQALHIFVLCIGSLTSIADIHDQADISDLFWKKFRHSAPSILEDAQFFRLSCEQIIGYT